MLLAANRVGKEQPYSSLVLTKDGWKEMGSLSVGDKVLSPYGKESIISEIFEQGVKDVYKLTFNDGSSAECGIDHLWRVRDSESRFRKTSSRYNTWENKTLRDIISSGGLNPKPRQRHSIQLLDSLCLPEITSEVDPYTLGALLGDGGLTNGSVTFTTADEEIFEYIKLPESVDIVKRTTPYTYAFTSKERTSKGYGKNTLVEQLRAIGIMGCDRRSKHVPEEYKHCNTRLEVLQGLMDTDGWVQNKGAGFCSVSKQLAQDVADIARSLGQKVSITEKTKSCVYKGERKYCQAFEVYFWQPTIQLFKLKRKLASQVINTKVHERVLVSIEKVRQENSRCLLLDSADHLYITNDYIVTHNTYSGAREASYHLTGLYPKWWKGKRFKTPTMVWAASNTTESTRDILQAEYMGGSSEEEFGTGTIPKDCIISWTRRQGVASALDTVKVKHFSGGVSEITFKSYDQGRAKFQGTSRHFIHLDEEPPMDIFTECATRTMTVKGHIIITMTPLSGMTDVCEAFLDAKRSDLWHISAGWDDAPHLTEADKTDMEAKYPPHEVEARKLGIPTVGVGKIYPFRQEDITCEPFKIPDNWKRAYGMDFGWRNTAVAFGAYDENTDTWYIYDCYKDGSDNNKGIGLDPIQHTANLKSKGIDKLHGVCDPAGAGSSQKDGESVMEAYRKPPNHLSLQKADNSVSAGIMEVHNRLRTGRLKIFSHMAPLLHEMNTYARDGKGKVIKRNDHILDCVRYLMMSGLLVAKPINKVNNNWWEKTKRKTKGSWLTV